MKLRVPTVAGSTTEKNAVYTFELKTKQKLSISLQKFMTLEKFPLLNHNGLIYTENITECEVKLKTLLYNTLQISIFNIIYLSVLKKH